MLLEFQGLLATTDDAKALLAERARLEASLRDAESLAPLLLGRAKSGVALDACAGMRESAAKAVECFGLAADVLASEDEAFGLKRKELQLQRRSLVEELASLANTAAALLGELRKRAGEAASA